MTSPALAPYAPCGACGKVAALSGADCAVCMAKEARREAARAQLEALASPLLGAWAASWSAAGLSAEDLEDVLSFLDFSWAEERYARGKRRAHLRRLRRAYPLPPASAVTRPPARVSLDLSALPVLAAFWPTDPRPGMATPFPSPVFEDDAGRFFSPLPGLDTLTLSLPDGRRAALYAGLGGRFPDAPPLSRPQAGCVVPPLLWPAFEVYMSGRENWGRLPVSPVRVGEA